MASLMAQQTTAFRGAASSRRCRLESVGAGELMLVARMGLFGGSLNCSSQHVVRVLTSAAERDNDEARWLLGVLARWKGPEIEMEAEAVSLVWLKNEMMLRQDSPRALYYAARADWPSVELLQRSAEGGFAPAMAALGMALDEEEGLGWLRKAAELSDPDGLYGLACKTSDASKRLELLQAAAARGHSLAMLDLTRDFSGHLGPRACATLLSRYLFLQGRHYFVGFADIVERVEARRASDDDVQILFNFGREMEGYKQLWGGRSLNMMPSKSNLLCIELYLLILHRAKRAALQAVVGLRAAGLPRDLARLIARLVYGTRDDAAGWFPCC